MNIFTIVVMIIALVVLGHTLAETIKGKYNLTTFFVTALIVGSLSTVLVAVNNLQAGRHDAFPNNVLPFLWEEAKKDLF